MSNPFEVLNSIFDKMTREEWAHALRVLADEADQNVTNPYLRLTADQARRLAWWLNAAGPPQTLQCGCESTAKSR